MTVNHIIAAIEAFAPRWLQESWDNSGLQVGLPAGDDTCTGVLLCVDATEAVVQEAIERGCNLVVSHHPLIFKGLKRIAGSSVAERTVAAAIRGGVAIYSAHTNLDSTRGGISYAMAEMLGAKVERVLSPMAIHSVLTVTAPTDVAANIETALLDSGLTDILSSEAQRHRLSFDDETLTVDSTDTPCRIITAQVPTAKIDAYIAAIHGAAGGRQCQITSAPAGVKDAAYGLGVVARFDAPVSGDELARRLRDNFKIPAIRTASNFRADAEITSIALCGGSGGEFIGAARGAGVQAYISADIRYHDMAETAQSGLFLFDIGHFESESCAKTIFYNVISNNFPNFAVYLSDNDKNPVEYLI